MQGRIRRIGLVSALALVGAVAPASAATFTNSTAITFGTGAPANGSPYPSPITVSGETGMISDVNVTLNQLSHTFPDDLAMVLVSPSGDALLLMDGAGDDPDLVNVNTTFDDQASARLPNTGAWTSGSYLPTAYFTGDSFPAPGPLTNYNEPGPKAGTATLTSTFGNTSPNGTWNLYTRDLVNGDGGSMAGGWSLTIRTSATPPQTTLGSGPPDISSSANAAFGFSADITASFQCSMDGAAFSACTSPRQYSGLSEGSHTFSVRAVDVVGGTDASPASRTFMVDTVAPTTSIDSGPSGVVNSSTASFGFSANEAVTFSCKLDDAAFAPCTSPQDYSDLADGLHVFQVRATDAAGNVDSSGAARAFTVQRTLPGPPPDTQRPTATVTKPKVNKGKTKATITFTGTDNSSGGLSFMCSLDGNAAQQCTSPTTYKHLKPGTHSFFVVAQDPTGNLSAPATTSFKVKPKK